MHGGQSPGAPKGNKNAFRYSADAIGSRRAVAKLIRRAREMTECVEADSVNPGNHGRRASAPGRKAAIDPPSTEVAEEANDLHLT
jgi:hypothetical protein